MKDPMKELHDIVVKGLGESIHQIEEATALREEISARAYEINEAGFGQLFGGLQITMGRYAVLAVTRLFDPPDDRFPAQSIPSALSHLRFNADYLQIANKEFVIGKLIGFGHHESQFEGIADPWITQLVRKEYADRLPNLDEPDSNNLSRALNALMTIREKSIAASGAAEESDTLRIADAHRNMLLEFARDFLMTIRQGYLNIPMEANASGAGSELRQLLTRANILVN